MGRSVLFNPTTGLPLPLHGMDMLGVSLGQHSGYSLVRMVGRNPDIDTGTVPEDFWGGGGTYTGFPVSTVETITAVSTDATDTGTVTFRGLRSPTATEETTETVTLSGTTPVVSEGTWWRVRDAFYRGASATGFNAGTITLKHSTTTSNLFISIGPGTGQAYAGVFTVPAGKYVQVLSFTAMLRGGATSYIDVAAWVRPSGGSPRLLSPATINAGSQVILDIPGGSTFPAGTDFTIRAIDTTGSNLDAIFRMDLLVGPVP